MKFVFEEENFNNDFCSRCGKRALKPIRLVADLTTGYVSFKEIEEPARGSYSAYVCKCCGNLKLASN